MEDKFRIKAIKAFIIFLAAMFVMTFAARVIYSEKLPKVTAQKAEIRRLSHSIKCSGTVEGVEKIPVYTEEGLRVAEVPAKNGSKVIKGDVLIKLDTKYLAEKIQLLEKEIAADIENDPSVYSEYGKSPVYSLGGMRVNEICVKIGDEVTCGQALIRLDCDYLFDKLCDLNDELQAAVIERDSMLEMGDGLSAEAASVRADSIQRQYDKYNSLYADGGIIFSERDGIVTGINIKTGSVTSDEAVMLISGDPEFGGYIAEKQEKLCRLKTIADDEGKIIAPENGWISGITLTEGDITFSEKVAVLEDTYKGLVFAADITEDEKKYFAVGDLVPLKFRSGEMNIDDCEIKLIHKNRENDLYRIEASLKSNRLSIGETGTLSIDLLSTSSYNCLPLSAINDINGTNGCIYVIEEKEGFLGMEYTVKKADVTIDEQNDTICGFNALPAEPDDLIVTSASKKLYNGQKIRIMKE